MRSPYNARGMPQVYGNRDVLLGIFAFVCNVTSLRSNGRAQDPTGRTEKLYQYGLAWHSQYVLVRNVSVVSLFLVYFAGLILPGGYEQLPGHKIRHTW